jgi:hypothetical protein
MRNRANVMVLRVPPRKAQSDKNLTYTSEKKLPYFRLYFSYRELGTRYLLQ